MTPPTKLHNNEYNQQDGNDTIYKVTQYLNTTSRMTIPNTTLLNNEYNQQDGNNTTYKVTQ